MCYARRVTHFRMKGLRRLRDASAARCCSSDFFREAAAALRLVGGFAACVFLALLSSAKLTLATFSKPLKFFEIFGWARSRLYRNQILQMNMHFEAFLSSTGFAHKLQRLGDPETT